MEINFRINFDFGGERVRYLTASEIAKKWYVSERSVRNYCAKGRVEGAILNGKTWNVPEDATKPERTNKKKEQGKHHYVAISHGMKKMSRVIFSVLKSNVPFVERF